VLPKGQYIVEVHASQSDGAPVTTPKIFGLTVP